MFWQSFKSGMLLLMCSALITIAHSFPTGTEHITTTSLPQNETTVSNTKGNKKPLVFIMEEKTPKSESIVIQFVYSSNGGNSITESKGSDKDKYSVSHPTHEEKPKGKFNISEKEKEKSVQTLKINKTANEQTKRLKSNSTKDVQMMAGTFLMPEEISPISGKLPKYLYDAMNPIWPFPEMQFQKQNKINTDKVQSQYPQSYLPYLGKEKKDTLNVAGPRLSPLSIYDREFNVPIFD